MVSCEDIIACMQEIIGGISNSGYWGIAVEAGKRYFFSALAADPSLAPSAVGGKIGVSPPLHPLDKPLLQSILQILVSCTDMRVLQLGDICKCIWYANCFYHGMRVLHDVVTRCAGAQVARWMRVALESQDGRISYASATFHISSADWQAVNATLSPLETDDSARLGIAFQGPGKQPKRSAPGSCMGIYMERKVALINSVCN